MPKRKLDAAFCAVAQCEDGKRKTDWYDTDVKGFVLEARSSGGKTYYLRYDDNGRQRQAKICNYGDITFDKAKKEATRLRSEVTLGGDPLAKKREARAVPTYAELAAQHMADAKLHARSYATMEGYMRVHLLPKWGRVRVSEIDPRDVGQWLASKRAEGLAPATVLKLKMIMSRSYTLGQRWNVPGTDRNPTRGVTLPPLNNARERYLTAAERSRLLDALKASKNSQLAPICELLMLTGARLRELLDARWENVDVDRRRWFIPTSKTGKSRWVPLSQAALDVVAALPRFDGCPWLVPNPETLQPFVSIKHGWQAARAAAGLQGLRLHDLRHDSASAMAQAGVDLFAIGKVLGHASYQSTQRYAHLAQDTLLAAVEAGAAKQRQL